MHDDQISKMKKTALIISLLILALGLQHSYGQRYLEKVFPKVDSAFDKVYGHAVNYKGDYIPLYFDFYEPQDDHSTERPLLIYAHGGGFTGGSPKVRSIKMMCKRLAHRGYTVASITYRVDPRFDYFKNDTNRKVMTDAMHDMRTAVRFFKANHEKYRIDTANIFVGGESAGAVAAMMVGYVDKKKELEAYPMSSPSILEGDSSMPGYSAKVKAVLCLCGLLTDTLAMDAPTEEPPLLWVHGSSDPIIPFSWAEEVPIRAEHIGLPHEKIVFDGATHCPWIITLDHWQLYLDSVVNYMSHYMYSLVTGKEAPQIKKALPRLHVADILQSNMVIQQDKPFRIWGISYPGDTVFVRVDWLDKPLQVYAGKDGLWVGTVKVPKATPGDFNPRSIEIWDAQDTIKLSNLLIGEVWLCAGQSNMDMKVSKGGWYRGVLDYEKVVADAKYPAIRVFTQPSVFNIKPQRNTWGKWQVCSPRTAGNFSAVAYFFGRELYDKLQVPVGLVVSAVAGASGQAFVPEKVLTEDAVLKREYWDPYKSFVISQSRVDSLGFFEKVTKPTLIYNGMIDLLERLSVRGIIWYQGESNYDDKGNYTHLLTTIIKYWRQAFNQGTLPFYFTQIAPYTKNEDKNPIILPLFWEAQQNVLQLKGTGMALTVDVGDTANVHPRDKKPVGGRLAKIALNKTYGFTEIQYRGPVYKNFTVDGHTVKINYVRQTTGTGLTTNDGMSPRYFMIAGKDRVFHEAKAEIVGDQVWVHSDEVAQPVAVRYSFNNAMITNLENKESLPAMPFRTDNWDK